MPKVFEGRAWEIKSYYSLDILDSIISSIRVDIINNSVVRIVPCLNESINEEWITNKARFSYDTLSIQRLQQPICVLHGNFLFLSWKFSLTLICNYLYSYKLLHTEVICGFYINLNVCYKLHNYLSNLGRGFIYYCNNGNFIPNDLDIYYLC